MEKMRWQEYNFANNGLKDDRGMTGEEVMGHEFAHCNELYEVDWNVFYESTKRRTLHEKLEVGFFGFGFSGNGISLYHFLGLWAG
jgi:hypothetical protein